MWKVEIEDAQVEDIQGTSQRTGKPYHMRKQSGYLHAPGQRYPEKFEFLLDQGQAPFAPGLYRFGPGAIHVDRRGGLSVSPRFEALPPKAS